LLQYIFMKRIQGFSDIDLARNNAIYDSYYKSFDVDGWSSDDKQYNFSHLSKVASISGSSFENASVLDVGCGTGDFAPYLRKKGVTSYLGVDIYAPAILWARQKYPMVRFMVLDILAEEPLGKFDFVFCSGALSVRLPKTGNYDFFAAMLKAMWHMTKKGLALNVLTDDDPDPDPDLFYYNIEKVKNICKKVAPKANMLIIPTPLGEGRDYNAQSHIYLSR